jgi:hypothetical protein
MLEAQGGSSGTKFSTCTAQTCLSAIFAHPSTGSSTKYVVAPGGSRVKQNVQLARRRLACQPFSLTHLPVVVQNMGRQLIDFDNHFDDLDWASRRRRTCQYQSQPGVLNQQLPRDHLHNLVADANLQRPVPRSAHQR